MLTRGLRQKLKADNEAVAGLARKLGLLGDNHKVCRYLRTGDFLQIMHTLAWGDFLQIMHMLACNNMEMKLLGTFLQELQRLSLREDSGIADKRFFHFAESLCVGALPKLTSLLIHNTFVGEDGAVALSAAVCRGAMSCLSIIRLTKAGMNDAALKALVPALLKLGELDNIRELDIRDNDFSDNGLTDFFLLFPSGHTWGRPDSRHYIWVLYHSSPGVRVQLRIR